jgi:hypothetical protein
MFVLTLNLGNSRCVETLYLSLAKGISMSKNIMESVELIQKLGKPASILVFYKGSEEKRIALPLDEAIRRIRLKGKHNPKRIFTIHVAEPAHVTGR